MRQPTLATERLVLRPFQFDDAHIVQKLAGDRRIYDATLNVPHPYEDGMAEKWISRHALDFYHKRSCVFAVCLKDGPLIGAMGLQADLKHQKAELGYWVGVPYWNSGYCTEAAIEIIRYGFAVPRYHRIEARHLAANPASGRVMAKAGMTVEGRLRDGVCKDGVFHDVILYGILATTAS